MCSPGAATGRRQWLLCWAGKRARHKWLWAVAQLEARTQMGNYLEPVGLRARGSGEPPPGCHSNVCAPLVEAGRRATSGLQPRAGAAPCCWIRCHSGIIVIISISFCIPAAAGLPARSPQSPGSRRLPTADCRQPTADSRRAVWLDSARQRRHNHLHHSFSVLLTRATRSNSWPALGSRLAGALEARGNNDSARC